MKTSCDITVWMFDRLGLDGALAGDLLEERARGRSSVWYWRQVLVAVWTGIWSTVFAHKVLALRAVATGCAANAVWLFLWMKFLHIGLSVPPPYTKPVLMESIACLLIILWLTTSFRPCFRLMAARQGYRKVGGGGSGLLCHFPI